jgi:hypothetical protein
MYVGEVARRRCDRRSGEETHATPGPCTGYTRQFRTRRQFASLATLTFHQRLTDFWMHAAGEIGWLMEIGCSAQVDGCKRGHVLLFLSRDDESCHLDLFVRVVLLLHRFLRRMARILHLMSNSTKSSIGISGMKSRQWEKRQIYFVL